MVKKTVMVFGAFDGVHSGHLYYLKEAKKLGNHLIVAIARDHSPWHYKVGFKLPEAERMKTVEMLDIANEVILGSETDPLEKIKKIKPDIVALTPYHPVTKKELEAIFKDNGITAKVITIPLYNKSLYDVVYGRKYNETLRDVLNSSD